MTYCGTHMNIYPYLLCSYIPLFSSYTIAPATSMKRALFTSPFALQIKKIWSGNSPDLSFFEMDPAETLNEITLSCCMREYFNSYLEEMSSLKTTNSSQPSVNSKILLTGPDGSERKYVAKALCGSLNKLLNENNRHKEFQILGISGNLFVRHGIDAVVNAVKKYAPVIVLIDEFHLINRGVIPSDCQEAEKFLSLIDIYNSQQPNKPIILICSSNHACDFDIARKKSNWFQKEIRF